MITPFTPSLHLSQGFSPLSHENWGLSLKKWNVTYDHRDERNRREKSNRRTLSRYEKCDREQVVYWQRLHNWFDVRNRKRTTTHMISLHMISRHRLIKGMNLKLKKRLWKVEGRNFPRVKNFFEDNNEILISRIISRNVSSSKIIVIWDETD